jgi:TRAP-type C4-dicarboxylate transport system permease small subunit
MTQTQAAALLKNISKLERVLTTFGFIAMTLILFADVVARELTHSGLITARQYGVYANIVVVMFGLGIASANDAHLRPRFVDSLMSSQFKAATEKLRQATTALFAWACAWLCAWVTLESYQLYEVSALTNMPIAPFMAVMPCAFTLMAIRHSIYVIWPGMAQTEIDPSESVQQSGGRA